MTLLFGTFKDITFFRLAYWFWYLKMTITLFLD